MSTNPRKRILDLIRSSDDDDQDVARRLEDVRAILEKDLHWLKKKRDETTGRWLLHDLVDLRSPCGNDDGSFLNQVVELCCQRVGDDPKLLLVTDHRGLTALHVAAAAAKSSSSSIVDTILRWNSDACFMRDQQGYLPLHHAIRRGTCKIVELLLDRSCQCNNTYEAYSHGQEIKKMPLLHFVIRMARSDNGADILRTILRRFPNSAEYADAQGRLPLHFCLVDNACPRRIEVLVQASSKSLRIPDENSDGNLPLHLAIKHFYFGTKDERVSVLQRLLEAYPQACAVANTHGCLPLHLAAQYQTPASILELMTRLHPEAHLTRDGNGNLPLHVACQRYQVDLPSFVPLLSNAADSANKMNAQGQLPLHVFLQATHGSTKETSNLEVLHHLIQASAEPTMMSPLLVPEIQQGNLPIHSLLSQGRMCSFSMLKIVVESCPEAMYCTNRLGMIPLHTAWAKGVPISHLKLLVEYHRSALTTYDTQGYLPFHHAVRQPHGIQTNDSTSLLCLVRTILPCLYEQQHAAVTLPPTRDGTPALVVAATNNAHLDVLRFLAEFSPEWFEKQNRR